MISTKVILLCSWIRSCQKLKHTVNPIAAVPKF